MKLLVLLSLYLFLAVSTAEGPVVTASKTPKNGTTNGTAIVTHKPTKTDLNITGFDLDGSMVQRALYVLVGITIIGVLYFLVRAVRLKKTTQRKKYGLLSNYDDTVEMAQLESDEDDTTVYEAKSLRR